MKIGNLNQSILELHANAHAHKSPKYVIKFSICKSETEAGEGVGESGSGL